MQYRQTLDSDIVVQSVQLIHMNLSPMSMQHPTPPSWTSTHFPCTCFCFSYLLCTHSHSNTPHASFSNICTLKWEQSWNSGKLYSQTPVLSKGGMHYSTILLLLIISGNAYSHNPVLPWEMVRMWYYTHYKLVEMHL